MNVVRAGRIPGIVGMAAVLILAAGEGRGGEITVSPGLVDFGQVSITGPQAISFVTITNTGTPTMVNGLAMGGCSNFGAFGFFPIQLGSGQSMNVDVAFDPDARGPRSCNVTVLDGDTNNDSFQLTGVGIAPSLSVVSPPFPQALVFSDQAWNGGVPETLLVQVQNTGDEAIQEANFYSLLSGGEHFSIVGSPQFPIGPMQFGTVPIAFDPTSEGEHSDALILGLTNDPLAEPDRVINLHGRGTTPTTGVDPLAGRVGLRLVGSNPVTGATRLAFTTPERGRVTLALFDMTGRLVRTLHDRIEEAGPHEWAWSRGPAGTPSGVYLVRLSLAGRTLGTSRVVVLRGLP